MYWNSVRVRLTYYIFTRCYGFSVDFYSLKRRKKIGSTGGKTLCKFLYRRLNLTQAPSALLTGFSIFFHLFSYFFFFYYSKPTYSLPPLHLSLFLWNPSPLSLPFFYLVANWRVRVLGLCRSKDGQHNCWTEAGGTLCQRNPSHLPETPTHDRHLSPTYLCYYVTNGCSESSGSTWKPYPIENFSTKLRI